MEGWSLQPEDHLGRSCLTNSIRCHRLHKICGKQTPAPARKRKAPKPMRVAELEKRLEDLTARVESRQVVVLSPSSDTGSPVESESSRRHIPKRPRRQLGRARHEHHLFPCDALDEAPPERFSTPRSESNAVSEEFASVSHSVKDTEAPAPGQEPHEASPTCVQQAEVHQQWHHPSSGSETATKAMPWYYPTSEEAQISLDDYRNIDTNILFPFVVVPKEMSPEQLRYHRTYHYLPAVEPISGLMEPSRRASFGPERR